MKSSVKTALGIDISESHINTVVLKKTAQGLKVLSAGRVPIGEGVIESGRVVDSARLMRILKAVKRRHRVRSMHVALSLPVKSTLARVVSLEESDPQRIVQFIQEEVRQYAAFSGRETVSDYRVLAPTKGNTPGKVLVAAADYEATFALTRACQRAGIGVTDVEPAVTVCASMLDGAVTLEHPGGNRVVAFLKEGTLILCVFRNGVLDFAHTQGFGPKNADVEAVHEWVANEINAVIGFYNLQGADAGKSWGVIVVDDEHTDVAGDVEECLKTKVKSDQVAVVTRSNQCQRLGVAWRKEEETSVTAVGLAMRLLTAEPNQMRVNLLPQGVDPGHTIRHSALLAANALAVLVLVAILVIGAVGWMVDRINRDIMAMRVKELSSGVVRLPVAVTELGIIKERIAEASAELDCIALIDASRFDVDWVQLLNDICQAVPRVVRITELSIDGTSTMFIEGISQTYPAVHLFGDQLARSDHIGRTEVKEAGHHGNEKAFIRYTIECTLVPKETL